MNFGSLKLTQKQRAVMYMLLSAFGFATMSMLVKLSGDLPVMQKSFFRNLIAALVAVSTMKKMGVSFSVKQQDIAPLLARSIFGTIGLVCNYYAVSNMILADATILAKLSPFFTLISSWILLGEKVGRKQKLAICLSFAGCMLVVQPGFSTSSLSASFVAILGGLCAGVAYTYVRMLTQRGMEKMMIIFGFSAFSCLVSVPFLIFDYAPMTWTQTIILLGAGFAAALGQFGMTNAYALAPGRFLGPF